MAREILGGFGPDSSQPQKPRASKGGIHPGMERDVMGYQPPVIPGWDPHGSKSPGLGGTNLGCCGTQGQRNSTGDGGDGMPGIKRSGGEGRGMGTNRKG